MMNFTQKERLNMEINHIARHQELDKFNYNYSGTFFIGSVSIMIALLSMNYVTQTGLVRFIVSDIIFLILVGLSISSFLEIKRANKHFMIREKMIEKRIVHFEIYKDQLEDEYNSYLK